mgnify:CR=1 FL=1
MNASLGKGWHILFMTLLPAFWVAISTALAGLGWILFARSQHGRFQANVLPWLSLPFFAVSIIYLWFGFAPASIDVRAAYARLGFMIISVPQAIILIVLYFLNRGDYGKSK